MHEDNSGRCDHCPPDHGALRRHPPDLYRNFLDKYDLINWYFDKLLARSFEHMGRGTTVLDSLEKKFTYIQEEKAFFAAAFRYDRQNSLRSMILS